MATSACPANVTFTGASGATESFAGAVLNPTLTLHRHFELDLSLLLVSEGRAPLLLLGNDLFRDHAGFKFLGLLAGDGQDHPATVRLLDKNRSTIFEIPCILEPSVTHGNGAFHPSGV